MKTFILALAFMFITFSSAMSYTSSEMITMRKHKDACEIVKKIGAGKADIGALSVEDRFMVTDLQQNDSKQYDYCYESGRKYGDISWSEIEDKKKKEELSSEDYTAWKTAKEVDKKVAARIRQSREKEFVFVHTNT